MSSWPIAASTSPRSSARAASTSRPSCRAIPPASSTSACCATVIGRAATAGSYEVGTAHHGAHLFRYVSGDSKYLSINNLLLDYHLRYGPYLFHLSEGSAACSVVRPFPPASTHSSRKRAPGVARLSRTRACRKGSRPCRRAETTTGNTANTGNWSRQLSGASAHGGPQVLIGISLAEIAGTAETPPPSATAEFTPDWQSACGNCGNC